MEVINKLEAMIAPLYQKAPRLPRDTTDWIADNAWWLALLGAILGLITVLGIVSLTFFAGVFFTSVAGLVGATLSGIVLVGVILALTFSIIDIVLLSLAVNPLKNKLSKGWTLIFISLLIHVISVVVNFLFTFDVLGLIWSLTFTVIGGYLLFEVRHNFKIAHVKAKATVKK